MARPLTAPSQRVPTAGKGGAAAAPVPSRSDNRTPAGHSAHGPGCRAPVTRGVSIPRTHPTHAGRDTRGLGPSDIPASAWPSETPTTGNATVPDPSVPRRPPQARTRVSPILLSPFSPRKQGRECPPFLRAPTQTATRVSRCPS